jgi:hypothetical protein
MTSNHLRPALSVLLPICLGAAATMIVLPWRESHPARGEQVVVRAGEPASGEKDPLVTLNNTFRVAYGKARKEALAKKGPVILVEGDYLTLLHNGKHTRVRVIPDLYHRLKDVAHVPLALFVERLISPSSIPPARQFAPHRWPPIPRRGSGAS